MPVTPASLVLPGRFRAAVFDMDGLLLDTEPLWHDAERELLERHGDTFSDADLEASHGRALVDTAAAYAERLGLPADAIEREIGEIMLAHYVAGAPLHAGVRELVDALEGRVALAVASNTVCRPRPAGAGCGGALGAGGGRVGPGPRAAEAGAGRVRRRVPGARRWRRPTPSRSRTRRWACSRRSRPGCSWSGVPERPDVDLAAAGAHVVLGSLVEVIVEG